MELKIRLLNHIMDSNPSDCLVMTKLIKMATLNVEINQKWFIILENRPIRFKWLNKTIYEISLLLIIIKQILPLIDQCNQT